jgi:hypothetical protein
MKNHSINDTLFKLKFDLRFHLINSIYLRHWDISKLT